MKQEEARLKTMQCKERTRRLFEIGGLAVKVGIDELPKAALYDRFLQVAAEAKSNPKAVPLWEQAGSRYFQKEADTRVVAIARCPDKIAPEVSASLRAIGFRWNRYPNQWEAKVGWADAKKTVDASGGMIETVKLTPIPL